ncbi:oxidoreductase [Larkinella knui]|uniref:SDR family oxidoreductase n=1 Tax=Larkinella knui TaxID=2025310 RepID=A0A3P1CB76_9BACT|nr:SDR family oxidoreductase [Larkinella knui]RRB10508.1 SDR family oxidoreductase [Larkinella knui]
MMKTVFITGASSGFGHQTATLFQKQGWNVVATMRSPQEVQGLDQLPNVLVTQLDVQDEASITRAVEAGIRHFGRIDVLVNNAGYGQMGVFESTTREQILKQFNVNVFGLMDVTRAVLPHMRKQGSGTIINISSFAGQVGMPFGSPYISSKFAVEGFSESLSHELQPLNISVKLIEPGSVATNFGSSRQISKNDIAAYEPIMTAFFKHLETIFTTLPKASPEDVARTIYEAATDQQSRLRYVVGGDGQFFIDSKYQDSNKDFSSLMRDY